jgi:hypothetical protein
VLDSWRQRRRMLASLEEDAGVALPLLEEARSEVEAAAHSVRDQGLTRDPNLVGDLICHGATLAAALVALDSARGTRQRSPPGGSQ